MEINLSSCPEYVFAKYVFDHSQEETEKEICHLLQQTARFGVEICSDQIVESYEQLTENQYKWFYFWFSYNHQLALENKEIDENNCHPEGNWQDFDYTI